MSISNRYAKSFETNFSFIYKLLVIRILKFVIRSILENFGTLIYWDFILYCWKQRNQQFSLAAENFISSIICYLGTDFLVCNCQHYKAGVSKLKATLFSQLSKAAFSLSLSLREANCCSLVSFAILWLSSIPEW